MSTIEPQDYKHALAVCLLLESTEPQELSSKLRELHGCRVQGYWMGLRMYIQGTTDPLGRSDAIRAHNALCQLIPSLLPDCECHAGVRLSISGRRVIDPAGFDRRACALSMADVLDLAEARGVAL